MPELPLIFKGKPVPQMDSVLLSIMLSPNDIDNAITHFVVETAFPSNLGNLIISHQNKRAMGGSVAGNVFLTALRLKWNSVKDAGFGKAIFLLAKRTFEMKSPAGHHLSRNRNRIRQTWHEYGAACHLWAANLLLIDGPHDPFFTGLAPSEMKARIESFLRLAAHLHDEAVRLGLAVPRDIWTVPPQFRRGAVELDPEIQKLSESWRQALDRYVPEAMASGRDDTCEPTCD